MARYLQALEGLLGQRFRFIDLALLGVRPPDADRNEDVVLSNIKHAAETIARPICFFPMPSIFFGGTDTSRSSPATFCSRSKVSFQKSLGLRLVC
jgi:hypothetical protein